MWRVWQVCWRDIMLLARNPREALLPLLFFLMMAAIFPLVLGPSADTLSVYAPAIIWSAALLASLLTQESLFNEDYQSGVLEQMLLSGQPMILIVLGKALAHWLAFGMTITLATPLLGVWFSMDADDAIKLMLTLPLGTAIFSMLAVFAAALLARGGGRFLGALICLPLCMPVIIFASAAAQGQRASFWLLAALLAFSITVLLPAAAGALRLGAMR